MNGTRGFGRTMITPLALVALMALTASGFAAAGRSKGGQRKSSAAAEGAGKGAAGGWISLFDGKTLDGWKANETTGTFVVENGVIVAYGKRGSLFYVGPVANHNFKNFELRCDVMTTTGANSGIFFHSQYQETGWPRTGFEAQIDSSHKDPIRSGSLYNIKDIVEPDPAKGPTHDGTWFRYDIIVRGKQITLKIDGKTTVDYTEPEQAQPPKGRPGRRLSSGTFALQAHPPGDAATQKGIIYFKDIMVRPLPD